MHGRASIAKRAVPLVTAVGGGDEAGRLFLLLRGLYAGLCGRVVGSVEFGVALGSVRECGPIDGATVARFDRGVGLTSEILSAASLVVAEAAKYRCTVANPFR